MVGLNIFNPLIPTAAKKQPDNFDQILPGKGIVRKIFDGEMLVRTYPTTLPQMFCKIIFNFKVMVKSSLGPDDYLLRNGLRSVLYIFPLEELTCSILC